MCRHFEYLILTIAMTCTLVAGQQRPAGTAPGSPQARQEPLTDRDVVQMVQSGKPEAGIVASIRSSRTNFDFSPQGCRLLTAGHVSRTILNAMGSASQPPCASTSEAPMEHANATGALLGNGNSTLLADASKHAQPAGAAPSSGGDRVALNPQPLPPRTAAKSGAGSPGANVAQATAAVSDYRQPPGANVAQATAAVSDYRQPSGTKESSGSPGTPLLKNPGPPGMPVAKDPGPAGQPAERNPGPAGFAGGARPALPAAFTGGVKVVAGKKVTNALATNSSIIAVFRQQKQAGTLQPGHTMAAGSMAPNGVEPSNAKLKAVSVYTPSNLLTAQENALCQQREAQGLAPEIFRISGKPKGQGVVYSPDPQANPYTIVGCGFGNTAGNVILGFFSDVGKGAGAPTQKRALNIQTWNDHEVVASLDQNTSGSPDWDAVRLLVSAQKTTESAEGTFYARRQTVQLPSIPVNQTSLYQQGSPYFLSPVSNYYGLNGTVAVMRQGLPGPVAGQDQFTLQLPRGFVVESMQTDLLISNTSANVTSKPASINGNTITVTYPIVSYGSGTATSYYSIYGLTIWVTGPAGVTP